MAIFRLNSIAFAAATISGAQAAWAHTSAMPHAHPHLHTVDGALLGLDALTLVSLGLFGVAFLMARMLARARTRRKK